MDNEGKAKRQGSIKPAFVGVIVVVIIAVIAVGAFYWKLAYPDITPVNEILNDLRTYDGKTVTVRGNVVNTLNVVLLKTYELDDGTGTITVVTERGLPKQGDTLTVTGVVSEVFQIAGVNYTVIMEPAEPD